MRSLFFFITVFGNALVYASSVAPFDLYYELPQQYRSLFDDENPYNRLTKAKEAWIASTVIGRLQHLDSFTEEHQGNALFCDLSGYFDESQRNKLAKILLSLKSDALHLTQEQHCAFNNFLKSSDLQVSQAEQQIRDFLKNPPRSSVGPILISSTPHSKKLRNVQIIGPNIDRGLILGSMSSLGTAGTYYLFNLNDRPHSEREKAMLSFALSATAYYALQQQFTLTRTDMTTLASAALGVLITQYSLHYMTERGKKKKISEKKRD